MKKSVLFAALGLTAVSLAAMAARMPEGSFLKSPVSGTKALAAQVTDDAIVAARYAKHFGISRNIVVHYFKNNLQVGRLRHNYETTVYVVTGRTDIKATGRVLAAGTYVFVDETGRPVLEFATGNPLIGRLPDSSATSTTGPGSQSAASASSSNLATDGAVSDAGGASAGNFGVPSVEPALPVPADGPSALAATEVAPLVDIVPAASIGAGPGLSGASHKSGALLPLAVLLGGAAAAGGSGGGTEQHGPSPSPIAEPAGLTALGIGISSFAVARFRRRR